MFIDIFSKESQWKSFIEKYKGSHAEEKKVTKKTVDTLISDEDIWSFVIGAIYRDFNLPLLVVTSTPESSLELMQEIKCIAPGAEVHVFPGLGNGIFYKNKNVPSENIIKRLKVIKILLDYRKHGSPPLIIATSNSLLNLMDASGISEIKNNIKISTGMEYNRDKLITELVKNGYERVHNVYDCGEYSVRGEVVDIYDITGEHPLRIDFFGDEVEKIFTYDIQNRKIARHLNNVSIFPNINPWEIKEVSGSGPDRKFVSFIDLLSENVPGFFMLLCDPVEVYLKIRSDIDILNKIFGRDRDLLIADSKIIKNFYLVKENFLERTGCRHKLNLASTGMETSSRGEFILSKITGQKKSSGSSIDFIGNLKNNIRKKRRIIVSIGGKVRRKKIEELLLNNSISYSYINSDNGFSADLSGPGVVNISGERLYRGYESGDISLYGELDIYEQMQQQVSESGAIRVNEFESFKPGEYVVHKTHGVGRYIDITSKQVEGCKREYFLIEYAGNDRLYVPTWQADRITRYIGANKPLVTSLTSKQWENIKKRVRKSVHRLAVDLARLYAERNSISGYAFPPDSPWQKEIEDLFPFRETPDQIKAIGQVKKAMSRPEPMDVLVVGDVGFGKTEVAVRAAFKSIESGKQVLMLVPTTILADQHYNTFSERYKDYPVILEVLSRFKTRKEQMDIVKNFNEGRVDMLIGTHRILQEDIKPGDLGLVIVDEEQRFGVNSKEKIKLLKTKVDVLTLSATPIPRTLYMSLAGIRDMVLIETHPEGRNPIKTFVGETDYRVIAKAVDRELARGGQVYYVYNKISGIENKKIQLEKLMSQAKIALTHGQMEGEKIEKIMREFIGRKYDILLTTSIIESGMDIGNVNTLIVENSHLFGLSQLYQLRGRVGRSNETAYAYFFYPGRKSMSFQAFQRLKTLSEYTELGSGYNIAMRDLEIRGAGEILGARQHGHINSVGFNMYCQIIREEIEKLKGMEVREDIDVQIDLPVSAYIPKSYIRSEKDRINIYRVLGNAKSLDEINEIKKEMVSRYKNTPRVVDNLVNIARIKYLLKNAGIEKLVFLDGGGIYLKKVNMSPGRARAMTEKNKNLSYEPVLKKVVIKKVDKNVDLDLVLGDLNDIIRFM